MTLRKCNADHAVKPAPPAIKITAMSQVGPLGSGHGRESHRSASMDKATNVPVKTPKIIVPIGVRSVRVFLVPVAAR